MATSSAIAQTKSRFGVPITSEGAGILQPKLKYRFRVSLLGGFGDLPDAKIITQNVQSVTRPTFSVDEIVVHSYNSRVYLQGKHEWNEIELVVRDDVTNETSKLIGRQVQRQFNHFEQTTPAVAGEYKFDMQIESLDGNSTNAIEVWFLEGAFLKSVNYSDSEYSSSEPQTISLSIRYDNAIHFQGDNSLDGRISAGNNFPASVGTNAPTPYV